MARALDRRLNSNMILSVKYRYYVEFKPFSREARYRNNPEPNYRSITRSVCNPETFVARRHHTSLF